MRAIDADALMPKLKFIREAEHQIYGKESWEFASKCITAVEDASTIEERKTGKWIAATSLQEGQITWIDYKCSNCSHHRGKPMNFCEVCGAKMER